MLLCSQVEMSFCPGEGLDNILECQYPLRCSGGGGSDWRQESPGNTDTLVTMMGAGVLARSRGASGECLMRRVGIAIRWQRRSPAPTPHAPTPIASHSKARPSPNNGFGPGVRLCVSVCSITLGFPPHKAYRGNREIQTGCRQMRPRGS